MRIIGNRGNTARKVQAVASGVLASGDTVIVNANGTVSVISGVAEGAGTPVVFQNSSVSYGASTFDSNSNKVVIVWFDSSNSTLNYMAAVGTVNGSTISFGTAVAFEATNVGAMAYPAATFDSNSNKVVIAYNTSTQCRAVVGTVSGTDISFGSPVVYYGAFGPWTSATFDSNSNKVVISYAPSTNSYYGTSIVGTVSGTTISFGTSVVFESARADNTSSTFDSNLNKVVVAYKDRGNAYAATAIVGTVSGTGISFGNAAVIFQGNALPKVTFDSDSNKVVVAYVSLVDSVGYGTVGTVSGTSISFGSPVVFNSSSGGSHKLTAISTNNSKAVFFYANDGNSSYGTAIVATVNGTSISFDSPVVFEPAGVQYVTSTFDSNSNKAVVAYQDAGNGNRGTSAVFTVGSTNLTTENFIGVASNGYATGQAATINVKGFIDDNQSGLTAGQSYFVQTNGDLGLTAANPSVFAGTAVSATKLIVKG